MCWLVIGINIQIWASNFSSVSHQYLCCNYGSGDWAPCCPSEFINHSPLRWLWKETAVVSSWLQVQLLTQTLWEASCMSWLLVYQDTLTCIDRSRSNWTSGQWHILMCKWSLYGLRKKGLKPLRIHFHPYLSYHQERKIRSYVFQVHPTLGEKPQTLFWGPWPFLLVQMLSSGSFALPVLLNKDS